MPGTATLNKGGNAQVGQVSCARTSVCVAVGTYTNKAGSGQWFTVTERNGRWGTATQVPYPTLNQASISTVWCAPGGLCAAAGTFTDSAGASDAWVRTEVKGRWQPALAVPGLAALNAVGNGAPGVSSVVCASAGNCAAGGLFNESPTTNLPVSEAFVVTQTNGTWGSAEEMPGIQTVNQGQAGTSLVTCPSAGNCFAGGYYAPVNMDFCDVTNCRWAFVVNERHGKWDNVNLPNEFIVLSALTCPATGDCVAVGQFIYGPNADTAGELLSETNDRWATPQILYSVSGASSVSCASPGYCAAGGQNVAGSAFVISQWHGTWGKAVTPAGILDRYSSITAMACPPKITLCIAGGNETPAGSIRSQPFIVSQTG